MSASLILSLLLYVTSTLYTYIDMDDEDRARYARALRKKEQRSFNRTNEAALDEIAPRETGRDALLAKRRARNEFRKRERSPDVELSESDLMGGDDFKAR